MLDTFYKGSGSHWRPAVLFAPFSVVIVLVCFATALPNDFIMDDVHLVARNETIRSVSPLRFLSSQYWDERIGGGFYRPLTTFSFSVDYALWGPWVPGFRSTNLVLHALNGWLVFLLAHNILRSTATAWVVATIYLGHPVHTEAVVGIVGRGELLAATFFFSAWLLFRKGRMGWSAAAFALSLLAKENALIFPAILMIDLWLEHGSFKKILSAWPRFAVLAIPAVVYLTLRFWVLGGIGVPPAGQYLKGSLSQLDLWMTSGRVFLQYFRLVLAPVVVTGDYDFNSIPVANLTDWDAWMGLGLVGAAVVFALLVRRTRPLLSMGLLFFFTALLPVSNWILRIGGLMAERYLYTPLFGVALLAGIGWAAIPAWRVRQMVLPGIFIIAAILSNSHNLIWRNEFTYYGNLARVLPNNLKGRFAYGSALLNRGRVEEAREQFKAGLQIASHTPALISALAATYVVENRCGQALPMIEQALQMDPRDSYSLWLMGDCLAQQGKMAQAERAYRRSVESTAYPAAKLLLAWGLTLEATARTLEAAEVYKRAARIDPGLEGVQQRLIALEQRP